MITALVCTYMAGDVIRHALNPLVASPRVNRIIVADGPTGCDHKAALLVERPTVEAECSVIDSPKIGYHSLTAVHRAAKCNLALAEVPADTTWILVVDSDEVWAERDLERLWEMLQEAEYDRYRVRFWNPYPDLRHHFLLPQESGRIYRWFPDARCPDADRLHQYVLSDQQTRVDPDHHWGCALLPDWAVVRPFHLNALRLAHHNVPEDRRRVTDLGNGQVVWRGGKQEHLREILPLEDEMLSQNLRVESALW